MSSNEQTSKSVASRAGKLLRDDKTPKRMRPPIASALTQAPDHKPDLPKKPVPKWVEYLRAKARTK